jgi:hypothetical protein
MEKNNIYNMHIVNVNSKKITFISKLMSILAVGLAVILLSGIGDLVYAQHTFRAKSFKPILGWSSWSFVRKHPTAAELKAQARALHKSGLQQLGYKYINLDDFWYKCPGRQGPDVDHYGRWVTDPSKFPAHGTTNGIKVVANYVHSLGLKFGIYLTPGISKQAVKKNTPIKGTPYTANQIAEPSESDNNYNCGGMVRINFNRPGAQTYYNSIADRFAKWGVDFIKFDGTRLRHGNLADIKALSKAIQQSGRPMVLSVSESYLQSMVLTDMKYAGHWMVAPDIEAYRLEKDGSSYPLTKWANIKLRFDYVAEWQPFAGPGGYNYYDSIEIGNGKDDGLTPAERKTQLSLWALASAPLILGADLTHLNKQDLKLLKNKSIIAVDQDGIAAKRFVNSSKRQVFAKMEPNGDAIVGLFNISKKTEKVSIQASTVGLPVDEDGYSLANLWTGKMKKIGDGTISATVPSHGVVLYRVKGR